MATMLLEASTTKTEEGEGEEDIGCGEPGKNKKGCRILKIFLGIGRVQVAFAFTSRWHFGGERGDLPVAVDGAHKVASKGENL